MKRAVGVMLMWAAMTWASGPVNAGPNEDATILIHLVNPTTKNACTRSDARPACADVVTEGDLWPATYFAYLLVADGDATAGISGLQCGITYLSPSNVGVDIFSWTNCATLEFPSDDWPDTGTGNLITWNAATLCQTTEPGGAGTGVVAVAGYFYCTAYSPDLLKVIPRPADQTAKVAACDATEDTLLSPTQLGYATFSAGGLVPGYSPCGLGDTGGGGGGSGDTGGGGGGDSGGGGGDFGDSGVEVKTFSDSRLSSPRVVRFGFIV